MNREEQTYSTNTGEFIAEKLLPCPFCGGEPEFITIGNDYTKSRKAEIKCTNCFVKRTTGAIRNDLEWCGRKAIELWNKRTNGLSLPPAEGAVPDNAAEQNKRMREWFKERTGLDDTLLSIHMKQIDVMLKGVQQQSTAEGAEEILRKNCNTCYSRSTGEEEVWSSVSSVLIAMQDFATFHAQRIADKMVSERLREELIRYIKWYGGFNYENMTDEMLVNEYLNTREK